MSNFISVDKLYYAVETADPEGGTPSYTTPKSVGKSVKISIDATIAQGEFYGNGSLAEVATQFVSAKVSLETEVLPIAVEADILGHSLDSAGGIVYSKNDHAPNVAIMYRRLKANGHYRYLKLFKVKFSDGKDEGETVSNSVKVQDSSIDGIAYARYSDGNWKAIKDQDEAGYTDVSTSWFASVGTVDVTSPTVSTIVPAKAATAIATTASIVITMSEAVLPNTLTANNVYLIKDTDDSIVPTTVTVDSTNTIITIAPTTALTAATKYIVNIDNDVLDLAGNRLAEYISYFTTA